MRAKDRVRQGQRAKALFWAAELASAQDGRRAARLLGAAEALRKALRLPRRPIGQFDYERDAATACALLHEQIFATAWAEGRAMSLDEAIAYALDKAD